MQDEHGPFLKLVIENGKYFLLICVAVWGGTAAYIKSIKKKGLEFSMKAWIGECSMSGFAGLMALYYCQWAEFGGPATGIITGVAGMMASNLMARLEDIGNDLFNRYFPHKEEDRPENKS
jgi:hypothetical protein